MNLRRGWPTLGQLAPVYAIIVVLVFSWSLYRFFWRFPSWTYFATAGEIAVILAYMTSVNVLESLLVLLAPIGLSVLLPDDWFHSRFVSRGVSLVALGLGFLMYLDSQLQTYAPFPLELYRAAPLAAVAVLLLVFVIDRVAILRRGLEALADRATVFLYVSIPLGLVAVATVLIRNVS